MSDIFPKKFVGLHAHTGMSVYDGLGYPNEHFEYAMENGMDAMAITEHGHLNSYAHAQLWVEEWNKNRGEKPAFKYIPGIEAYYHPSIKQWEKDKKLAEDAKLDKKAAFKLAKEQEKFINKLVVTTDADDETEDIDMSNSFTIENEEESKSNKFYNPVNRRHHMVILPKNQQGLLEIFKLGSRGYMEGFYRFPRIDHNMLSEAGKDGNLIVLGACIAGHVAFDVFQLLQQYKFDELHHSLLDDTSLMNKVLDSIGNTYQSMIDAVGKENYFLELQFNKLPAQNLVNRAILEFVKRNGLQNQLITTADSHYARPELWRDRELYKKLGFMNYQAIDPSSLPQSKDELKCELYPKNANQMWDEYLAAKKDASFYDDQLVCDAIERTYHIAHNIIGETPADRSSKFPTERLIPQGEKSFNHLVNLCKEGLVKRGLAEKPEYMARLREELGVIKHMKNADYFISYQKIMELARKVVLTGPARGSGGGSLVAYILHITELDPLIWDLPFSRFLSIHRCLDPRTLVLTKNGAKKISDIVIGDEVMTHNLRYQPVTATWITDAFEIMSLTFSNGHKFRCTPNHKWLINESDDRVEASSLKIGDSVMSLNSDNIQVSQQIINIEYDELIEHSYEEFVDITVYKDHSFFISNNGVNWVVTGNSGAPDIDCVHENHLIEMSNCSYKKATEIQVGDHVKGGDGGSHKVLATHKRDLRYGENPYWILVKTLDDDEIMGHLVVVPRHKFVLEDSSIVYADELKIGDRLLSLNTKVIVENINIGPNVGMQLGDANQYVDITVEDDHRFNIVPFNVSTEQNGSPNFLTCYSFE